MPRAPDVRSRVRNGGGTGSWAAVYLTREDRCRDSLLPNPWKAQLSAFLLLGQETRPWPGCVPGTVATAAPIDPGLFQAGAEKATQLPQEAGLHSTASPSKVLDWGRLSPGGQSRNICGRQDGGVPGIQCMGIREPLCAPPCSGCPTPTTTEDDSAPVSTAPRGRPWVNYLGKS